MEGEEQKEKKEDVGEVKTPGTASVEVLVGPEGEENQGTVVVVDPVGSRLAPITGGEGPPRGLLHLQPQVVPDEDGVVGDIVGTEPRKVEKKGEKKDQKEGEPLFPLAHETLYLGGERGARRAPPSQKGGKG